MTCCSKNCAGSVDILSHLLANTYILLIKTQNVHWNVTGANFNPIHALTESHYEELFAAADLIAERIRKIGSKAPGSLAEFQDLACLPDGIETADSTSGMLQALLQDHQTMIAGLKKAIASLSDSDDYGTIDLLNSRLGAHEKAAWMLSANLEA